LNTLFMKQPPESATRSSPERWWRMVAICATTSSNTRCIAAASFWSRAVIGPWRSRGGPNSRTNRSEYIRRSKKL
jgi:hypothetical protein